MKPIYLLAFAPLIAGGCSHSLQGLKVRAQAPLMDEAFRKLSLVLRMDDYEMESIDPKAFRLETRWRRIKEREAEKKSADSALVRIALRLEPRGLLYDVFLTPFVRSGQNNEVVPEPGHPLFQKWQRVLNEILVREQREED